MELKTYKKQSVVEENIVYRFDVVGVVVVLLLLVAWFGGEGGDVAVCLVLAGVEVSEPVHSVAAACRHTAHNLSAVDLLFLLIAIQH